MYGILMNIIYTCICIYISTIIPYIYSISTTISNIIPIYIYIYYIILYRYTHNVFTQLYYIILHIYMYNYINMNIYEESNYCKS